MDINQILSFLQAQKQQQEQENNNINNVHPDPIDQVQNESMEMTPSQPLESRLMEVEQTPPIDSSSLNIPTGMSLAAIDPSLIAEVRQEFLSNQQQQKQDQNNYMSIQKEESYQPEAYNPEAYNPEAYDPEGYQPEAYDPEASQMEPYYSFEEKQPDNSLDSLLDSLRNTTKVTPQVLEALGRMCRETDLLSVLRECQQSQHNLEEELNRKRQEVQSRHQKSKDALFAHHSSFNLSIYCLFRELVGKTPDYEAIEKKAQEELRKIDMHILRQMDNQLRSQQGRLAMLKVPFFKQTNDPAEIQMQHKILSILLDMIDDDENNNNNNE
ncbi:hypothetical protein INT45_009002 [Circinella minor]|uniref:Uncharacterized protein n=1 Tax=Circinella minor TaxID=1195481 RepID=A0A8H7S5X4_9FUNG|nr:hypothetical protein INT45_009002 [Circinella minor]